jgi:hypothetical protein
LGDYDNQDNQNNNAYPTNDERAAARALGLNGCFGSLSRFGLSCRTGSFRVVEFRQQFLSAFVIGIDDDNIPQASAAFLSRLHNRRKPVPAFFVVLVKLNHGLQFGTRRRLVADLGGSNTLPQELLDSLLVLPGRSGSTHATPRPFL